MKKVFSLFIILFATPLYGAMPVNPSYVASDGSGSSCTIGSPCALSYANANVGAGDTVYLRNGTYTITGDGISPSSSGSSGSVITFSGYQDEVVTITGDATSSGKDSRGINLNGDDYIKITKINFTNMYQGMVLNNSDHNEISYCTFAFRDAWATGENGVYSYDPAGIDIGGNSVHNWIHHNVMHGCGGFDESDQGVLFAIGATQLGTPEENSYNTVEYNHIYHGGHHTFGNNYGFYNVIRKNYFHNEGWFSDAAYDAVCSAGDNGVCGYRVIYSAGDKGHAGRALYEENFVGYGGQYGRSHIASGGPGGGMTLGNDDNIVRYNSFVLSHQYGLGFDTSLSSPAGDGEDNRVYNNTFFENGYNFISYGVGGTDDSLAGVDAWRTNLLIAFDEVSGNVLKNNLTHGAWSLQNTRSQSVYYPNIVAGTTNNKTNNIIENNYVQDTTYDSDSSPITDTDDPLFVDDTLPDDSAAIISAWSNYRVTTPNLSLQASSPAKDAGTYLTTVHADDTGSGTSLILTDASYFQDGSWGSDLTSLAADWICVGDTLSAAECFQVGAINYATNTITVVAFERADADKVWLYKKSDGEQVLFGDSPDFGAHEFTQYPSASGITFSGVTIGQ
jgi:hypothetical protein